MSNRNPKLELLHVQTLWRRSVADGATAIMAGGGNGNRNMFIPGAIPHVNAGTFSQGTSQAGAILISSLMNIDLAQSKADRIIIRGGFLPSAISGTQTLTPTVSKIQAIAWGTSYIDSTKPLFADLPIFTNNVEVAEVDRANYAGDLLYLIPNDSAYSAPRMSVNTGSPMDVVASGGFFQAPRVAAITVAGLIGKYAGWEFEITKRNSGATQAASEATGYPMHKPGVSGLAKIRLCLSMVNTASAAYADGTTCTLDGEVVALHFREVD